MNANIFNSIPHTIIGLALGLLDSTGGSDTWYTNNETDRIVIGIGTGAFGTDGNLQDTWEDLNPWWGNAEIYENMWKHIVLTISNNTYTVFHCGLRPVFPGCWRGVLVPVPFPLSGFSSLPCPPTSGHLPVSH